MRSPRVDDVRRFDSLPIRIGRASGALRGESAGADCIVRHESVSGHHATIRWSRTAEQLVLVDEGGRNGTYVGGVKLKRGRERAISSGDWVQIGAVWICIDAIDERVCGELPQSTREMALNQLDEEIASLRRCVRLRAVEGAAIGERSPELVDGETLRVGRAPECGWSIADEAMSRQQIEVTRRGDAIWARALASQTRVMLGDVEVPTDREVHWPQGMMLRSGTSVFAVDRATERVLGRAPQVEAARNFELEPSKSFAPRTQSRHWLPNDMALLAAGATTIFAGLLAVWWVFVP